MGKDSGHWGRNAEITGLTWSDIDMKNRTISVNHQLIYKNFGDGCKFHVSEPKTDAGKRTIPMTETVHRAFVELYQFLISREPQPMIGWRFSMCKK
jgi:integrase